MLKKLTTKEFITKAKKVHGDKYNYSKVNYINNKTKVCIICKKHGEFWQVPGNHIRATNPCNCPKCGKLNRAKSNSYSTKEFISKAKTIYGNKYDYSKVKYINNSTKICIICPIHGEFWQRPDMHLSLKNGCPKCAPNTKLNNKTFITRAKEVHNNKYNYSKTIYINNKTKVCIICPEHGEFWQRPDMHLSLKNGCPKCGKLNRAKSNSYSTKEFISKAKEIHSNKYDYSKVNYINNRTKVCIICPIHGEFWQKPSHHISNKNGCPKCCTNNIKLDNKTFITKAREAHGDKYDYSKVNYTHNKTKVCIICPEHGEFWQKPNNHISDENGCPKCASLKSESKKLSYIKNYLSSNNIEYYEECTFPGLAYKSPLRIDLVIPSFNLYIEYDGIQHFKSTFPNADINLTHTRDQIKNQWALEHEINFLRIPYVLNKTLIKKFCRTLQNKNSLLNFVQKHKLFYIEQSSIKIFNESYYSLNLN